MTDKAKSVMVEAQTGGLRKQPKRTPVADSKRPGPPAARGGDFAPEPPLPVKPIHGPSGPPSAGFGPEHLRQVLELSADVSTDRLCEDAALEIERLRSPPRLGAKTWDLP